MKKICTFIILFLLFMSTGYAASGKAYCPDDNEPVSLRSTIGGNFITGIPCNSSVEVLDINSGSTSNCKNWYKVRYGISTGYSCSDYIKLDNSNSTSEGKVLCIEDTSPLGVYSDLNRKNKLTGLSCDTKVTILDKNAGKDGKGTCSTSLYKIKYGDTTGYVCGKYIGDVSSNNKTDNNSKTSTNSGDNTYKKDNYNTRSNDGVINCYEDTGSLSLRSSALGSKTGKSVNCGDSVKINSTVEGSGKCPYYYNITNGNGDSGYVCGIYVNTTKLSTLAENYYKNNSLNDYYTSLKNDGFPDSYLPYLAEIHARHPNWKFNAENIKLSFDDIVNGENAYGRNLLQGSAFDENYYSMDINNYDVLNNKFNYYPTEYGWYNASSEAIAYYLDPRNYLNVKYIFAFESLLYNPSHDISTINKIVGNTVDWNSVYGGTSKVSEDILNATKEVNISSTHIASRINLEIGGVSISDPRLGGKWYSDNNEYSGYYNFFNIGVYGSNKIVRGMNYAKNNDWSTPYKAILGGSSFIRNDYVGINQDTIYYEKFDVSTDNGNYTHQYQQNLSVSASETNSIYSSYVSMNDYLSKELVFTIPVYENMPKFAVSAPKVGNPNNYLSDLKIDGKTISDFSYDNFNYVITVPSTTKSINISANKIASTSNISGIGDVSIDKDNIIHNVIVTAQNGNSRVYSVTINRDKKIEEEKNIISIESILNSSGIRYNNNYIYGINENTAIDSLINNIKKTSEYASATIKDNKGNYKSSGIFTTGDVVIISNSKEEKTMNIVIYGDANGDGKIDKDDCLTLLRHLNGYTNLKDSYKVAGDANKDGKIDKDDCLAILRHLNGYTNLNK